MRVKNEIYLYSTPLDPEYRNVYDNFTNRTEYEKMLFGGNERNGHVCLIKERELSLVNGMCQVILDDVWDVQYPKFLNQTYRPFSINNFNYCRLFCPDLPVPETIADNRYFYFFIVDIETITNKEVMLTLKYDSWANTILHRSIDAIDTNGNFITNRHYNTSTETLERNRIIPNGYAYKNNGQYNDLIYPMERGKRIIWQYVKIDPSEVSFSPREWDGILFRDYATKGLFPTTSTLPIFVIPYAVYDLDNRKMYPQEIEIIDMTPFSSLFKFNTELTQSYIIDSWFSFNIPYGNYRIDESHINDEHNPRFVVQMTSLWGKITMSKNSKESLTAMTVSQYDDFKIEKISLYPFQRDTYNTNIKADIETQIDNEDALKCYPFRHLYVKIGNTEFPLIQWKDSREPITIEWGFRDSTDLYVKMYHGVESPMPDNSYKWTLTNMKFPALVSRDAYASYLQTNENSLAFSKSAALITSALALLSGNPAVAVGGAIGGLMQLGRINAQQTDMKNALDFYINSSNSGANFINDYLDYPIIYERVPDKHTVEEVFNIIKTYGIEFNNYDKVTNNYRKVFDYVKTENCVLQNLTDIYVRRDLERAFDRGVTKWHYLTAVSDFGHSMDKSLHNYQLYIE